MIESEADYTEFKRPVSKYDVVGISTTLDPTMSKTIIKAKVVGRSISQADAQPPLFHNK